MSTNNILFIFEGERAECQITNNLQQFFINESTIIKCAYCAEIYQLYREINNDDDLDTFNLIKERNDKNKAELCCYERNDFAEIYLFFDYDAHASAKDGDKKIMDMLTVFDNETDKGKLYLSYPMVEALKHFICYDTFKELKVKCKGANCQYIDNCKEKDECLDKPHYKAIAASVNNPQVSDFTKYTGSIWLLLINAHLAKMNYIVNNLYEFPDKIVLQSDIFNEQLNKYINKCCPEVAVLSAFPVFIHDYYGNQKTKEMIG